jgi:hypothetical protein
MMVTKKNPKGADVFNINGNTEHAPEPEGFKCL